MKINGKFEYKKAIKLTKTRLQELESVLLRYTDRMSYSGRTLLGNEISFDDLTEVLDFENFGNQRLVSLDIYGHKGYSRIIHIKICADEGILVNYNNTVVCNYEFEKLNDVTLFTNELSNFFEKCKTSYWLLAKMRTLTFLLILVIFIVLISCAFLLANGHLKSLFSASVSPFGVFLAILLCSSTYFLDSKLLCYFIPVVFYWGEEISRFDKYEKLRSNLWWGVVIAIFVGIISSFLYSLIN